MPTPIPAIPPRVQLALRELERRIRRQETARQVVPLLLFDPGGAVEDLAGTLGTMSTQDADDVAITGGSITGMPSPTSPSDVATKAYVDAFSSGIKPKAPVVAATTTAKTLATDFENGDTIDGVVLATGNRVLIKDQTDAKENGIYVVAASGSPSRSTDADTGAELVGAYVFVEGGTVNARRAYVCSDASITIGVDDIHFVEFLDVSGALLAANNLSDLTNAATARSNIGLSTAGGDLTGTLPNPTIDANKVTDAKFRQSVGVSVVGRHASTTGNVADISAASDGYVLMRSDADGGVVFKFIPQSSVVNLVSDLAGKQASNAKLSAIAALANAAGALTNDGAGSFSYVAYLTPTAAAAAYQPLSDELTALAALATTGILARTGAHAYAPRTIQQGFGVAVGNGDGVGGDPSIGLVQQVGYSITSPPTPRRTLDFGTATDAEKFEFLITAIGDIIAGAFPHA